MSDNRLPKLSELIEQRKRDLAAREREILERATKHVQYERLSKRQQWLAKYGFPLDPKGDDMATPSPDEIPDDWNDGSEADYE